MLVRSLLDSLQKVLNLRILPPPHQSYWLNSITNVHQQGMFLALNNPWNRYAFKQSNQTDYIPCIRVLGMILNSIWTWGLSSRALGTGNCLFIPSHPVWYNLLGPSRPLYKLLVLSRNSWYHITVKLNKEIKYDCKINAIPKPQGIKYSQKSWYIIKIKKMNHSYQTI